MLVMVDERPLVIAGYATGFETEGMALAGFAPADFLAWIENAPAAEIAAIEAFLLGDAAERIACARAIALRSQAPVVAVNDSNSLETTLALFAGGFDDVVRKPIHVRELLARLGAIRRRAAPARVVERTPASGTVSVFFDGRDPVIAGATLDLPRRERRILEFLIANRGRRVTKTQIFNAIYGIFDEDVEENVIESHISKLRKKLRQRLGYDPIDSKRFLGYCIELDEKKLAVDDDGRPPPRRLTPQAENTDMSLFNSMRTAVSGMAAQSNALTAVSENIANSSTIGYKDAQAQFETVLDNNFTGRSTNPAACRPTCAIRCRQQGTLETTTSATDRRDQRQRLLRREPGRPGHLSHARRLLRARFLRQSRQHRRLPADGLSDQRGRHDELDALRRQRRQPDAAGRGLDEGHADGEPALLRDRRRRRAAALDQFGECDLLPTRPRSRSTTISARPTCSTST